MLFTANAFVRRDHLTYPPSANPLDDLPATVSQDRTLTNLGAKARPRVHARPPQRQDGRLVHGDTLHENFTLGITDPTSTRHGRTQTATFDDPSFAASASARIPVTES